ncbi:MAG: 16S rRNA (adenine(1518)-N(6)/adenine(1519)-N(6))-dimethyltransferase RsmA [Candidatus Andersenbacteria bacterium]
MAPGAADRRGANPLDTLGPIDPTNVADLKRVFALLRKPRNYKEFAQNFLVDQGARNAVVEAAALHADDEVLEVGPGSGVLTQQLVARARRVVALDIDPYLLEVTRVVCGGAKNLELRLEDVRHVNLPKLFASDRYIAASNVPYYLTGYVLELLTSSTRAPRRIVLTVQQEVAERLVAPPGQHTLLSISVATFGRAELVRVVPRTSFWPVPKVDSAIVRIERHATPPVAAAEKKWFLRVVKAGFSARRKKLSNALAGGLHTTTVAAAAALQAVGIQPNTRAQELTLESWAQLSRYLKANGVA